MSSVASGRFHVRTNDHLHHKRYGDISQTVRDLSARLAVLEEQIAKSIHDPNISLPDQRSREDKYATKSSCEAIILTWVLNQLLQTLSLCRDQADQIQQIRNSLVESVKPRDGESDTSMFISVPQCTLRNAESDGESEPSTDNIRTDISFTLPSIHPISKLRRKSTQSAQTLQCVLTDIEQIKADVTSMGSKIQAITAKTEGEFKAATDLVGVTNQLDHKLQNIMTNIIRPDDLGTIIAQKLPANIGTIDSRLQSLAQDVLSTREENTDMKKILGDMLKGLNEFRDRHSGNLLQVHKRVSDLEQSMKNIEDSIVQSTQSAQPRSICADSAPGRRRI